MQAFPFRGRCPSAHTGADEVHPFKPSVWLARNYHFTGFSSLSHSFYLLLHLHCKSARWESTSPPAGGENLPIQYNKPSIDILFRQL